MKEELHNYLLNDHVPTLTQPGKVIIRNTESKKEKPSSQLEKLITLVNETLN